MWILEKLRRRRPGAHHRLHGREAMGMGGGGLSPGSRYVLAKPVRVKMLAALLDRLWAAAAPSPASALPAPVAPAKPTGPPPRCCLLQPAGQLPEPRRIARFFGHSDVFARCERDAQAVLAAFARVDRHQSRRHFCPPARSWLAGGERGGKPPDASGVRHRPRRGCSNISSFLRERYRRPGHPARADPAAIERRARQMSKLKRI